MAVTCSQPKSNNPKNWGKRELAQWFGNKEWSSGWDVSPDESINQKEMAVQFYKMDNSEQADPSNSAAYLTIFSDKIS